MKKILILTVITAIGWALFKRIDDDIKDTFDFEF